MKTKLMSLLFLAWSGIAMGQTLSIPDVEALPGETVSYSLNINVEGGTYSGFQYQMQFPETGFTLAGTTISSAWDGGSLGVGALDASGITNGSAYSSSDAPVPAGDIEIGTVKFTIDESVPTGVYNVTISGFDFLDGTNYIHANNGSDVTFKVKVLDKATEYFTLDENSTTAPVARTGVNVRVKRTIKKDEWSTLCLPFDMTKEQVLKTFGDDVKLAYFEDYDVEKEGSNVNTITVNFEEEDLSLGFSGNYPYLIKISKDVTEFTVDGVNIDPDEDNAVIEYTNGKNGNKKVVYGTCKGIYQANTTVPENSLFLSGNQFWYSTGKTKMKAFRAYFTLQDILTDKSVGARINITDDETTGIKEVHGNTNVDGTYDLQGRKVEEPTNKGLYIVNGKKVVKK